MNCLAGLSHILALKRLHFKFTSGLLDGLWILLFYPSTALTTSRVGTGEWNGCTVYMLFNLYIVYIWYLVGARFNFTEYVIFLKETQFYPGALFLLIGS